MDDAGISVRLSTKQCDTRSFFVSSERSSPDLNDTIMMCYLCYSSFWIWSYIYLKKLNSHFYYFLLNIVMFNFSTYIFDNITVCIKIPNVTILNLSHLVYITLFGEPDGVALSRLGCYPQSTLPFDFFTLFWRGHNKHAYHPW